MMGAAPDLTESRAPWYGVYTTQGNRPGDQGLGGQHGGFREGRAGREHRCSAEPR